MGLPDRRVRTIQAVIERDLRTVPRIAELAASVGLSASGLEHLFRAELNTTIRDYVKQRRLRLAARMLRRSHERVSSIAFAVGFNHASNFNHAFKRAFGQAPLEYRRGTRRHRTHATAGATK